MSNCLAVILGLGTDPMRPLSRAIRTHCDMSIAGALTFAQM